MKLVFKLTQHSRDKELIQNIIKYLGCGGVFFQAKTSDIIHLLVTKFSYIQIKIIPFFKQHPVLGVKAFDFQDRCNVADLMSYKKNLSLDGLDKILKIKNGMNTNRLGCLTCVYCSSTYKGCILVKVNTNLFWCNRKIYVYNNINEAIFIVSHLKELYIVIDHFNKYPLITQKWFYCILFKNFSKRGGAVLAPTT